MVARALIREFPEYDYYWHLPAIKMGKSVHRNYNTLIGRYPGADGMKTGFICASGFNLVASATRDGKRLIAVVLGAPSSQARALKAAQLLERGFSSDSGLTWLMPSLGTVETMQPISAAPPNLRDEMCGPHRKRKATEDEDDVVAAANVSADSPYATFLSSLRPKTKGAALLQDSVVVGPPAVVYTGAYRKPGTVVVSTTAAGGRSASLPQHTAEFLRLAEQRRAAGVVRHERGRGTELRPRVGLVVGTDQRQAHTLVRKRAQHRLRAGKQRDVGERRALHPPHVGGDPRHFPQRHVEPLQQFARRQPAQACDLVRGNTTETELVGDIVQHAREPREAVRERAVEIEDGEGVRHVLVKNRRPSLSSGRAPIASSPRPSPRQTWPWRARTCR
jgi:D-alanyl-D-alanine carboxypeptidase